MTDDIVEWLTRTVVRAVAYKCETEEYVNPDGPKAASEILRLRAENEKLRAATGSLVRSLSGCWYAFEPSLRREMGNTNYHCVKEKMDEVEALLDLRSAAAAIREGERE